MALSGKIASGAFDVLIESRPAARVSDLTNHGGAITSGCATVVIGGAAYLAARVTDKTSCPESELGATGTQPHVGGDIVSGAGTVLIGGEPAAREGDSTLCVGPGAAGGGGAGGGGPGAGGPQQTPCEKLWADLQKEAQGIIAPGDHDHRQRNKIISGAYADLMLKEPMFQWAGLAAYASKQVGCAMDKCDERIALLPGQAPAAAPIYLKRQLGLGNRELFLDIYPMHRFFQLHGFARMQECAFERKPPIPAQAMDGFKALEQYKKTGDKKYLAQSVRSLAFHEQINILQKSIYVDKATKAILRVNEVGEIPATVPADVVMEAGCKDSTSGKRTHKFGEKGRTRLYDVDERMQWIDEIAADYDRYAGSKRHTDDMSEIKKQGAGAGATYP